MIKFGLLEDKGSGENRQVKLTDAGMRLVYQADPDSSEHKDQLQTAALLPTIHSDLWKKYSGELPSDSVIERYLVLERGFNSGYVKGFIKQFRRTIAFAGLTAFDCFIDDSVSFSPSLIANADTGQKPPSSQERQPLRAPQSSVDSSAVAAALPPGLIEIPVPLPSGALAYYRVPKAMSETDFCFYETLLKAFKGGLVKTVTEVPMSNNNLDE